MLVIELEYKNINNYITNIILIDSRYCSKKSIRILITT